MITPGQKIGTFQVGNLIGEGATASVFHATDTKLNRPVAIKVLKEDLPESSRERFVREVKTLVEVRHAAIVHVYTAGIEGGSPYYVMEHLSGRSIKEMITHRKGKGVPVFRHDEILSIGRQLAEALGALHKARIIHRDLKPSNVMIVPPMKAKVIDFGLVQVGSGARMGERSRGLGTQAYMSPEQLEGGLIGEQSDLFQIGLILHEMVTGEQLGGHGVPPWFGKSQWNPPLPSSTDPKLPPDLEKAIVSCLQCATADRCKDASTLLAMLSTPKLESILPEGRIPASRDPLDLMVGHPKAELHQGATPTAEVLKKLGRYEIHGLIATGAMGEVYRATQKDLDRPVAIKVMKGELVADESLKTRFRRELEALAKLQHPRIVAVYDVDFAGKIPFYVMELVEAPNLAKILMTRRPLGIAESLVIFQDLLEALSACHQRHLLHRDIKPENVLVEEDGHGKLTDFGLVKWVDRTVITMDDEMIGTPSYMAPEMVAGTEVDVRSDYYQAGMVLYEMVAGKRAIHAETLEEIWELVLKKVPESPRLFNPECPPALATLISNLLEKKPADRYGTADEIFADLARVRAGEDVVRRRATRKERQAPGQPQSALPAAGQRQAQATPSPSAGVAARQDPHAGQPVPEFTDPKAPPAPRSRPQPVGTKPARAAQRSDQQGFPLRLKLDLVLFVPLGGFVIWEFLLHRTYPLLWIVFLGLLVETAVTAWKTLMGVAAPAAFREPITVDNKLNVPVRLDFRGKTMGCVIERIDARSQCVIDVEVGAVMLFRREDNNAQVKKDVARKGLTIVLQDVRKG